MSDDELDVNPIWKFAEDVAQEIECSFQLTSWRSVQFFNQGGEVGGCEFQLILESAEQTGWLEYEKQRLIEMIKHYIAEQPS